MDTILIEGLSTQASIGVFDWEKQIQQRLELDLALETDLAKPARSEQLSDTLDYARISQEVLALIHQRHYDLIETLAETITDALLQHPLVHRVTLTLRKPDAVPQARSVGLRISRQRSA